MFGVFRACHLYRMFSIVLVVCVTLCSRASASGVPILPASTLGGIGEDTLLGWTPKPTEAARLGLRRQASGESPGLCGYVEGNATLPLSCTSTEYCAFDTTSSAFGCCSSVFTSSNTQFLTGCGYYTSCIDASISCNSPACSSQVRNMELLHCTEQGFPACVKYSVQNDQGYTLTNYGCFDVVQSPTPAAAVLTTTSTSTAVTATRTPTAFTMTQASQGVVDTVSPSQTGSAVGLKVRWGTGVMAPALLALCLALP